MNNEKIAADAEEPSEVAQQILQLKLRTHSLSDVISQLDKKLSAVLRPETENTVSDVMKDVQLVPVASEIRSLMQSVEYSTERLLNILYRVGV